MTRTLQFPPRRKPLRHSGGFTLVELLVVLAVWAGLVAILVPVVLNQLQEAKDKASFTEARAAYLAYVLKSTDLPSASRHAGAEPSLAALRDCMGSEGEIRVALRKENDEVTEFCFQNDALTERGRYIRIRLGDSGEIVEGEFPDPSRDDPGIIVLR